MQITDSQARVLIDVLQAYVDGEPVEFEMEGTSLVVSFNMARIVIDPSGEVDEN
jgi:hypothetical protein